MDIQDVLFSRDVPTARKQAIIEFVDSLEGVSAWTQVLVPTATNDDINGSQHVSGGGTDFTYEDASLDDVMNATTAGFYEYFSSYRGNYTGHYYNGSGAKFEAIVLNPPAYAASFSF